MSKKHKSICGVSLKLYYLDNALWSVCLMTVSQNAQGDLVWQTLKGIQHYYFISAAAHRAEFLAKDYGVCIYLDCHRGQLVPKEVLQQLRKSDLLDHLK